MRMADACDTLHVTQVKSAITRGVRVVRTRQCTLEEADEIQEDEVRHDGRLVRREKPHHIHIAHALQVMKQSRCAMPCCIERSSADSRSVFGPDPFQRRPIADATIHAPDA